MCCCGVHHVSQDPRAIRGMVPRCTSKMGLGVHVSLNKLTEHDSCAADNAVILQPQRRDTEKITHLQPPSLKPEQQWHKKDTLAGPILGAGGLMVGAEGHGAQTTCRRSH